MSNKEARYNNNMIKLLQDCNVWVDNGSACGDGCCWNTWWESEKFTAGEELDEDNPRLDLCNLEEGVDFVKVDS
jgi:hypothetical protein